jgi:hypothetical protein
MYNSHKSQMDCENSKLAELTNYCGEIMVKNAYLN